MMLAFFEIATDWLSNHQGIAWSLVGFSVLMVVLAAIVLPIIVVRIPADYFAHDRPQTLLGQNLHPAWRIAVLAVKNLLGVMLLIAGLIMLFVPGQGVLCMLLSLALLDIPGKRKLERWIVTRPPVFKALNALRRKYGHPPLEKPVEM